MHEEGRKEELAVAVSSSGQAPRARETYETTDSRERESRARAVTRSNIKQGAQREQKEKINRYEEISMPRLHIHDNLAPELARDGPGPSKHAARITGQMYHISS